MKEKLQEYALLAEIIGGIAIVLSLIFVGLQIRETNRLNRVEAYDRNIESLIGVRSYMIQNPHLTQLYIGYQNGEVQEFSRLDQELIFNHVRNILGNYEKAYFSYSLGIMGEPEWTRYALNICEQKERLDRNAMVDAVFPVLSDEFQAYIVELCDKP